MIYLYELGLQEDRIRYLNPSLEDFIITGEVIEVPVGFRPNSTKANM